MTTDLSASPIVGAVAKSTVLAGTRSFIVGLGGALAGITAILYACGYLVTRAHLNLLGLYGLIEFSNDYILQEGAKFFIATVYSVGRGMVLPWLTIFTALALIALVFVVRLRPHATRSFNAFRARYLHVDAVPFVRALAFIALFVAFLAHSDKYLDKFERPLCYANLLYSDGGAAKCGTADDKDTSKLRQALLEANPVLLDATFRELLIGLAQAILIAFLTWRVTLPWRWHAWCVAPSFFVAALYLLLLPMDYGVLQRSINYPRISVTFDDKWPFSLTAPTFLLHKSAGDFVVWEAASSKLIWIPVAGVKRAEIDGAYDLFNASSHRDKQQGEKNENPPLGGIGDAGVRADRGGLRGGPTRR